MGCNEYLIALKIFLGKAYSDLVCKLRRDLLIGMKGLRHVIEHSAVRLSISVLGTHEFLIGTFGNTVDT